MAAVGVHRASATVVSQWSWAAKQSAPYNSPSAATGTGTALILGMNNSYVYTAGETTPTNEKGDVTSTAGTAVPAFSEFLWRVRGTNNTSGQPGDGWNNSAPNYTQGAVFEMPTTGYAPTSFTFDWYCTTSGVANMQVRYTLDDSAGFNYAGTPGLQAPGVADPGIVWSNLGSDLIATPNDYYGGAGSSPTNTFSLAGLPAGAANDPNFAIELVSVRPVLGDANYSLTGPGTDGDYASADGLGDDGLGDYNDNSGNWRLGNITLNGTTAPVPEPATASLLGLAGLALLRRRHSKKA